MKYPHDYSLLMNKTFWKYATYVAETIFFLLEQHFDCRHKITQQLITDMMQILWTVYILQTRRVYKSVSVIMRAYHTTYSWLLSIMLLKVRWWICRINKYQNQFTCIPVDAAQLFVALFVPCSVDALWDMRLVHSGICETGIQITVRCLVKYCEIKSTPVFAGNDSVW